MHRAAVILLLAAAWPLASRAECGCLWEGSFAEAQAAADAVIAATVERRKGNSIDVGVARTLRGDVFFDTIRVWLQADDYCRPPAEDFPEGSRWVLALHEIDRVPEGGFDPATPNISYGRKGDYYLSSCGAYWLRWSGAAASGNLVDGARWARETEDTVPVLLDVIDAYVDGRIGVEALREASREDPARRELMLDTREFLRHGEIDRE